MWALSPDSYLGNYGCIPWIVDDDGDPLNIVIVMRGDPVSPLSLGQARLIGPVNGSDE